MLPKKYFEFLGNCIALNLYFRGEMPRDISNVKATFGYRLIDPSGKLKPSQGYSVSHHFKRSGDSHYGGALMRRDLLQTSGYLKDDAFVVECTLAVLRELDKNATTHRPRPADDLVPSSGLNHHLGELLEKGTGADVTLFAAGQSFAAHKAILASRSPVFMAEFFGHMKEQRSPRVEIKDMEAAVLGAMLHFIYTDSIGAGPGARLAGGRGRRGERQRHAHGAAPSCGGGQVRDRQAQAGLRGQAPRWRQRRHGGDDSGLGGAARLLPSQG